MVKKLLVLVAAAAIVICLGCEPTEEFVKKSQAEWTAEGWDAWENGYYEAAETAFGNALKVDPYYAEAQGGLGWTYVRTQALDEALKTFEDAILASEQAPLKVRQLIYMGATAAYEANDDYKLSAERGEFLWNNLNGPNFTFKADTRVTGYDLCIVLALDYYGLGDSANCVRAINRMRGIIKEPQTYKFTNWKNVTAEIERLITKDPS